MVATLKSKEYTKARALGHSPEQAAAIAHCTTSMENRMNKSQELQEYLEECKQRYASEVYDVQFLLLDRIKDRLTRIGKDEPSESFLISLYEGSPGLTPQVQQTGITVNQQNINLDNEQPKTETINRVQLLLESLKKD